MNWRAKIERKFEHLADFIFDNSKKTILAVLLVVVGRKSRSKISLVSTAIKIFSSLPN
jgi:hypothetical protein